MTLTGDAPILDIEEVSHQFTLLNGDTLLALENVNLTLGRESFVSLVGPSGCGKSTLLRMLAGFERPSHGRLLLEGQQIDGPHPHRGMVFQQDTVFPWMTVRGNVEYGPRCRGVERGKRAQLADYWINLVGLGEFKEAYPRELSGGMRKRVDLARVYANDPQVMLMDEPFGALDAQTKTRMQEELLHVWSSKRKTVVFVTHDIEEATFLSDQVVVLSPRPGRITAIEPIDLPRPRPHDLRLSEEFLVARRKLSAHLSNGAWQETDEHTARLGLGEPRAFN